MDSATIWAYLDSQRVDLADLVEGLTDDQWRRPSLCDGWTVGDVGVHLTQAVLPAWKVLPVVVRSGFRFNTMINRTALADRQPQSVVAQRLRDMKGCRRHPIGTRPIDSLFDVLVHGQDIAVPLGIERPIPLDAAVAAVERLWPSRFPFHPARDNPGMRFVASDVEFAVGEGVDYTAPMAEILMIVVGRRAAVRP